MKNAIDPALIIQLIAVVIQILMKLLESPQAVADYLSGDDLPWIARPLWMPFRLLKVRRIIRQQAAKRTTEVDAVTNEVSNRLEGMTAGAVLAVWTESQVGREG